MSKSQEKSLALPAELGFAMPAEWQRHEATWLGWPHNQTDWPAKIDTIRWVYGEMVRKIAEGEIVRVLVRNKAEEKLARSYLTRSAANLKNVEFIVHPTNRGWTRDSGPIFVKRKKETAIVHFHFNAWAKYNNWQKDRKVPETAARVLKKKLFNAECNGKDPSVHQVQKLFRIILLTLHEFAEILAKQATVSLPGRGDSGPIRSFSRGTEPLLTGIYFHFANRNLGGQCVPTQSRGNRLNE